MRRLVVSLCLVAIGVNTSAQSPEPLFVARTAVAAARGDQAVAGRGVVERSVVGMRIDWLLNRPEGVMSRVLLNVGSAAWIARLERVDHDGAGFRSWVGAIEGVPHSHVVFTERDGVVSGLIDAVGTTYRVRSSSPTTYLLERMDTTALGDELEPVRSSSVERPIPDDSAAHASEGASTIDVLMLYTPSARVESGGLPQIEALISQIMSDTNTAFARSGVAARMRLAATAEFPATEASQMTTDLTALAASPIARAWRDIAKADLVQLLVNSPDVAVCGYGYLLSSLSVTDFDAYSVADIACAAQYTPTHEMGHNLGSHHAPEDGASGALFPYSYGYKDPLRGFRTVMAYGCGVETCPRILNFSNPVITFAGAPTGMSAQDNARSINQASFTVANFRPQASLAPPGPTGSAPSSPTNMRSQVVGNTVTLAWDSVSSALSYWLQVGRTSGASDLLNASVGNVTAVSGAVQPGTYYWRVYASNAPGHSPASAESQFTVDAVCDIPSAPQDFAFSVNAGVVTLAWSAPASGTPPISYVVEAGTSTKLANLLNWGTGLQLSAVIPAPPGAYYVRIRATSACGTGPASDERLIVVQ